MRFSNFVFILACGGITVATAAAGCGGGDSSASTSTTGGTGGSASTSTSTGSANQGKYPCSPTDPVCTKVQSECIALEDNKGKDVFTLRMSQLTVLKPPALAEGVIKDLLENGVLLKLKQCNLEGAGSFNLLLQVDVKNNKIKIGGAQPEVNPLNGYKFASGMASGLDIGPAEDDLNIDASGQFSANNGVDLNLPIYIGGDAMPGVVLPMHKANIIGKLSDNNNCIGKYNADTLRTESNCAPDSTHPAYTDGADLDGYITLEEADTVPLEVAGQSLCVLLSDNPTMYGDGKTPAKCKRDTDGKIIFKGDWCSTTNKAADATCADATKLTGKLAASAVKYLP